MTVKRAVSASPSVRDSEIDRTFAVVVRTSEPNYFECGHAAAKSILQRHAVNRMAKRWDNSDKYGVHRPNRPKCSPVKIEIPR